MACLDNLRTIFRENTAGETNTESVLRHQEAKYLACIDVKHLELEKLLRHDKTHWTVLIEKYKRDLQVFLRKPPKPKTVLKRLPMWGYGVHVNQVNFAWPTQKEFERLPDDVRLKSIEFRTCYKPYLSWV